MISASAQAAMLLTQLVFETATEFNLSEIQKQAERQKRKLDEMYGRHYDAEETEEIRRDGTAERH